MPKRLPLFEICISRYKPRARLIHWYSLRKFRESELWTTTGSRDRLETRNQVPGMTLVNSNPRRISKSRTTKWGHQFGIVVEDHLHLFTRGKFKYFAHLTRRTFVSVEELHGNLDDMANVLGLRSGFSKMRKESLERICEHKWTIMSYWDSLRLASNFSSKNEAVQIYWCKTGLLSLFIKKAQIQHSIIVVNCSPCSVALTFIIKVFI